MAVELKKATTLSWRRFLQTEPGVEGLLFLREKIPSIIKGDQHNMIFDAGRVEGFKQALDTISEILTLVKEKDINIENP